MNGKRIVLLVSTHKGGFILIGDADRQSWEMKGPVFEGLNVYHMCMDKRSHPMIWASLSDKAHGAHLQSSPNLGDNWVQPSEPLAFDQYSGISLERIWFVQPGPEDMPNVLYAGVAPAALFRSVDGGQSWVELSNLNNHPSHVLWTPSRGGLMVNSLCQHPDEPTKLWVSISSAGTFFSSDAGVNWHARNQNVRADFLPKQYPEVGQNVHRLVNHPAKPDVLYQQNHCGVYRSDDGGDEWVEIGEGLPSDFGFPILIHPHDPDTIFVVPEESSKFRCTCNGEFAVYRSRDRGENWERMQDGLPGEPSYLHVNRGGLCADGADPCGLYVATTTGHIFFSQNDGEHWDMIADYMPPIHSITCALIDDA